MKYLIVAVVLLAAACRTQPLADDGGSSGAPDFASSSGAPDLSSAPPDLSFSSPFDFAMSSMQSCSALVQCIVNCTMMGGGQGCQQTCIQNATPNAQQLFAAAYQCAANQCSTAPVECMGAGDGSFQCIQCLNDALDQLFFPSGGCTQASDPHCDQCVSQAKACQADQ